MFGNKTVVVRSQEWLDEQLRRDEALAAAHGQQGSSRSVVPRWLEMSYRLGQLRAMLADQPWTAQQVAEEWQQVIGGFPLRRPRPVELGWTPAANPIIFQKAAAILRNHGRARDAETVESAACVEHEPAQQVYVEAAVQSIVDAHTALGGLSARAQHRPLPEADAGETPARLADQVVDRALEVLYQAEGSRAVELQVLDRYTASWSQPDGQ